MNDDVAALVEWLQTWSPVTANGQRAHLAAAELTRLAAENRTYAEAHAFNSERFVEMLSERDGIGASLKDEVEVRLNAEHERDQAKAEIARLTDYNARLHADIAEIGKDNDELEAEIARLTYERDVWKSKAEYYGRSKERVALTAEIARLREWKTAAENLIAAIRLDSGIAYPWPALDLADVALKPDTGE